MNARKRLLEAMAFCLESAPIDQMRVSDLTDAADVSRQTFYRLYSDKYELIKDFYQEIIGPLYEGISTPIDVNEATYKTLLYFKSHKNVARNMFFSKDEFALKSYFIDISYEYNLRLWRSLGAQVDDERMAGALRLYSYGTTSLLMEWIKSDMPGDVKVMADQFALAVPLGLVLDGGVEFPLELYR